jgi:hypothetical protein
MKSYASGAAAGIAALLFFAAALWPVRSVLAQGTDPDRRIVTVTGEGIVRVTPDMASVSFGIVTVADDPETARSQNAEASSTAMNAVRELGIEERYIRLETLQLQPYREYDEELRRYVEKGFEASRQVVVEVHDLEMLPTLITRIVQQGANRLNHVAYELQDRDQARNEALREAALNAREKAVLIVETLGLQLGELRQVNEQIFDFPRPFMRMESMEAMSRDAAPEPDAYAPGELEVRATLNVTFEVVE